MTTPFYRALNIDTTGELADMMKAQPGATSLRVYLDGKEMTGAFGGLAADGAMELHLDATPDAKREARRAEELQAVRDAAGPRDSDELSPIQRKVNEFNRETRERMAKEGENRTKFDELGIKEAPAGQPTGAEDTNVRENQFGQAARGDAGVAGIVEHRRAVERAANEPGQGTGTDEGKKVPLQKAESTARNPASAAHGVKAPLPASGSMSAGNIARHEAEVKAEDAKDETPAQKAERERRERAR